MKAIRAAMTAIAIFIALFLSTGYALADVLPPDECYRYAISSTRGPAGTIVSVAGDSSYTDELYNVEVLWDGTTSLATMPLDGSGNYSGVFTVPANATAGKHNVIVRVPIKGWVGGDISFEDCPFTFTVIEATAAGGLQPDAYAAAGVTTLPNTGLAALLPLAGLAAASAGVLIGRKCRPQAKNQR